MEGWISLSQSHGKDNRSFIPSFTEHSLVAGPKSVAGHKFVENN